MYSPQEACGRMVRYGILKNNHVLYQLNGKLASAKQILVLRETNLAKILLID